MNIARWRYTIPLRLRSIFRRGTVEAELSEELDGHLHRLTEECRRQGSSPVEARDAARRAMVDVEVAKEAIRDARRVSLIDELGRDLRYAARVLRATPTFTIVAVLTLALGIGATTTTFSVIEAVLLRPLPFDRPEELVRLYATKNGTVLTGASVLDAQDVAREARSLERLAVYDEWRKNVSAGPDGVPEQMIVGLVPREYFEALHVAPRLGRLFTDAENVLGQHYVTVIGESLWRDRFGGARNVLGHTLRINDEPYTIVGVIPDAIPDWFAARGLGVRLWTPYPQARTQSESSRGIRDAYTVARLERGVSIEQGRAEMAQLAAGLARRYPVDRGYGLTLMPLVDSRVGASRPILAILTAAVLLVLVIVCANLANLVLARNATRHRELVLRTVLGAAPLRIVRQLLVETMLLALVGGLAGVGIAVAGVAALARWRPAAMPQLAGLAIDMRVLGFAIGVSVVTGFAFGLGPAWSLSRVDAADSLRGGGRGSTGTHSQRRTRAALVVAETALALILVTATALLAESVWNVRRHDLGFNTGHLLKAHLYIPPARYPDALAVTRFAERFSDAVRELPGIQAATLVTGYPPVADRWGQKFTIEGRPAASAQDAPTTFFTSSDDRYLSTLGVPVLRGRDFLHSDVAESPPVAVINEAFVRRYFAGADPIGARIHLEYPLRRVASSKAIEIVGVFHDVANDGIGAPVQPQVIALFRQLPEFNSEFKDIVVRSRLDPSRLVRSMRESLRSMDPDMPLAEIATFHEVVASIAGGLTYTALLLSVFAALGLALAAIGTYGVIAYTVAQRTNEIGIRMAIGASRSAIMWLVVSRGVALGSIGTAIGLVVSVVVDRYMAGQLFEVSAVDPMTLAVTSVTLMFVAVAASVIPALRAMRIDPVRALRNA